MITTNGGLVALNRQRALDSLQNLPPFTAVLHRLLATLSSQDASAAHVAGVIEGDPVIAGTVLKLVNSALYGRRHEVNSIQHAVNLLGMRLLRNAVFAMLIKRVSNKVRAAPGWVTKRFNLHSVACGLLSDKLAEYLELENAGIAFTAGLFHDFGELLIAVGLQDDFAKVQQSYAASFGTLVECERAVIGISHADLSQWSASGYHAISAPAPMGPCRERVPPRLVTATERGTIAFRGAVLFL